MNVKSGHIRFLALYYVCFKTRVSESSSSQKSNSLEYTDGIKKSVIAEQELNEYNFRES